MPPKFPLNNSTLTEQILYKKVLAWIPPHPPKKTNKKNNPFKFLNLKKLSSDFSFPLLIVRFRLNRKVDKRKGKIQFIVDVKQHTISKPDSLGKKIDFIFLLTSI